MGLFEYHTMRADLIERVLRSEVPPVIISFLSTDLQTRRQEYEKMWYSRQRVNSLNGPMSKPAPSFGFIRGNTVSFTMGWRRVITILAILASM